MKLRPSILHGVVDREGKGRESFSESCRVKNADVSVLKRLATLCSHPMQLTQHDSPATSRPACRRGFVRKLSDHSDLSHG